MPKPTTLKGYTDQRTVDCERVLVTLLRGLGPWKKSVYLIGGLVPRYLVPIHTPGLPAHAGTLDVDVVIDLQILADTGAYYSLEENLQKMKFEQAEGIQGNQPSWRWQTCIEQGSPIVLEILADAPDIAGGKVQLLPSNGMISALNIPHSSIVFDLHQVTEIQAELLDDNGVAIEQVRHANVTSFTCLKALAFDQRAERKDAHDLVYCLEHAPEGLDTISEEFRRARNSEHGEVIEKALTILSKRFVQDNKIEGYRKDGPVAVAKFEYGESNTSEQREVRVLRQRHVSNVVEQLLAKIG